METEPRTEQTVVESITFRAEDGRLLAGDLVRPAGRARAQVVIHGATAVPRKHYLPFAKHLANSGFETLVYDYRGVGGSASADHRSDASTMSDWILLDAPAAVRALRAQDRRAPFFAIGHSFGGQIAGALESVPAPMAIATMGAQRGYWAGFPWYVRPAMFAKLFVLVPAFSSALGYIPGQAGLGVDMPAGIIGEWARWCRTPNYFLVDHPSLEHRLAQYEGRILALSVTDDEFAPLPNVEWLLARLRRASLEHVRFTPRDVGVPSFGHFGFFRSRYADSVWPEVLGFFEEALGEGERPRRLGRSMPPAQVQGLDDGELLVDLEYGRG